MSDEDHCPSCGVAWIEHLGMVGTCEDLQQALAEVRQLREEMAQIEAILCDEEDVYEAWHIAAQACGRAGGGA